MIKVRRAVLAATIVLCATAVGNAQPTNLTDSDLAELAIPYEKVSFDSHVSDVKRSDARDIFHTHYLNEVVFLLQANPGSLAVDCMKHRATINQPTLYGTDYDYLEAKGRQQARYTAIFCWQMSYIPKLEDLPLKEIRGDIIEYTDSVEALMIEALDGVVPAEIIQAEAEEVRQDALRHFSRQSSFLYKRRLPEHILDEHLSWLSERLEEARLYFEVKCKRIAEPDLPPGLGAEVLKQLDTSCASFQELEVAKLWWQVRNMLSEQMVENSLLLEAAAQGIENHLDLGDPELRAADEALIESVVSQSSQ